MTKTQQENPRAGQPKTSLPGNLEVLQIQRETKINSDRRVLAVTTRARFIPSSQFMLELDAGFDARDGH
jgi:hypothetical protein